MIQEREDEKYVYFLDYFQGNPVHIRKDKSTQQIFFDANDVCHILGLGSFHDFIGSDAGLDLISEWKRNNPGKEIFGTNGMFLKTDR